MRWIASFIALFALFGGIPDAIGRSLETKEQEDELRNRGLVKYNNGDFKGAIIDWEEEFRLNPQSHRPLHNLCLAQLALYLKLILIVISI